MNTCDTCKHWEPNNEPVTYYVDGLVLRNREIGRCHAPNVYSTAKEIIQNPALASINDFDSHHASPEFQTGPKFGCLHHEPKED